MSYDFDTVCHGFRIFTQGVEAVHYNSRRDVSPLAKVGITVLAVADLVLCFKEFQKHKAVLKWVVLASRFVVATSMSSVSAGDYAATSLAQWVVLYKKILKFSVNHFEIRKLNEPRIQDALSGAEVLLRLLFFAGSASYHRTVYYSTIHVTTYVL